MVTFLVSILPILLGTLGGAPGTAPVQLVISGFKLTEGILAGVAPEPAIEPITLWLTSNDEWLELSVAGAPSPRYGASMVWEPSTGLGFLFGGRDDNFVLLNESWTFDAETDAWTRRDLPASPEPRFHGTMAYDPIAGVSVLFGGGGGGRRNDTWVHRPWDRVWIDVTPAESPEPRSGHAMAFVPELGGSLIFGGWGKDGFLNDTWLFNATDSRWTRVATPSAPSVRTSHRMAYSGALRGVLLFGGHESPLFPAPLSDTWLFDPFTISWRQVVTSVSPSARQGHFMATNAGTGEVLLFGGSDFSVVMNDTWIFRHASGTWELIQPPFRPPAVKFASGYFDPHLQATVITGGIGRFFATNRTFAFGLHKPNGTFESTTLNLAQLGADLVPVEIRWGPTVQPPGTRLRAQVASPDNQGSWIFVGPDGTASSFYQVASGERVWQGHAGTRVLRVRFYFETTDPKASPELTSVVIRLEAPPSPLTPPVLLALAPADVQVGQPIDVQALVEDADGVAWVNLTYVDIAGRSRETPMTFLGPMGNQELWVAQIPAQSGPGVVSFRVNAGDAKGAVAVYPSQGSVSVEIVAPTAEGLPSLLVWALALFGTVAAMGLAYYLFSRKRKRGK